MSPDEVVIPEDALEESFLAATGPGGQNVNKNATACQLRVTLAALGLAPRVLNRLRHIAGSRVTKDRKELILTARTHRSREANREEARARLAQMIAKAHFEPKTRKKTRPSRSAKAKRTDAKVKRGAVKKMRGKVDY
ncbi:alternative ribosome rescue aminoacyl-tRNA hydrolase ArfB [Sphingomicrobium nitratireducens]|uniref:alternative ribosome rescue aminoacyl-tRNA hydrolase ArfB n=1 Tax=Sphingomicrobium nitratireducens TaxID=2964666 RepID=UPI00224015ED|nr:alternative ribosome rescue aminoacyl-tRNA hydrolase ArfB [Sphingomicrobium nitratireducens]